MKQKTKKINMDTLLREREKETTRTEDITTHRIQNRVSERKRERERENQNQRK